jgi:dihydroflavonol-4-reductase
MNSKVLVTGANGHLGANIVRSLLKRNYEVNAFVRKGADLRGLTGLPVTYCYGDILDPEALIKAALGCEAIIHSAAVYKIWAKTVDEVMRPAMEGTKNIFSAAAHAGIKRLVYTSSTYAIGTSKDPLTILTPNDWSHHDFVPYGVAKTKSEQLAWELSAKNNIPMISLCPAGIYGRYDYKVTPSNRLPFDIMRGFGMTVKGVLSVIDARDAGELHALALSKGKVGERYILSGGGYEMKEIGKLTGKFSGKKVLYAPFGRTINLATAFMMEAVAKVTGWHPPFTIGLAKEYSHRYALFDNSKTIKDFDYTFYSLQETIHDTIQWFAFISKKVKLDKKIIGQLPPGPDWLEAVVVKD